MDLFKINIKILVFFVFVLMFSSFVSFAAQNDPCTTPTNSCGAGGECDSDEVCFYNSFSDSTYCQDDVNCAPTPTPSCLLNDTANCTQDAACCSNFCNPSTNKCSAPTGPPPNSDQCAPTNSCGAPGVNGNAGCGPNQRCATTGAGTRCQDDSSCMQCGPSFACGPESNCPVGQMCGRNALNELSCITPPAGLSCPVCGTNVSSGCGYDGGCQPGFECLDEGAGAFSCQSATTPSCINAPLPPTNCTAVTSFCGQSDECGSNQLCRDVGGGNLQCVTTSPCAECATAADCPDPSTYQCVSLGGLNVCQQTVIGAPGPIDVPLISLENILKYFFAISVPAGIAFGMWNIVQAGYTLKTSEGNPQKIKEGQEQLTAAILGTLFILLSLVILRVIITSIIGVSAPGF